MKNRILLTLLSVALLLSSCMKDLGNYDYKEISDRIKTVLPESSIVGLLLCHEKNYEVVQSTNSGVLQHDAMSWEVLGTQFVYLDELSSESMTVDNTIKTWLKQLDAGQRQEIVQSVFSLFLQLSCDLILLGFPAVYSNRQLNLFNNRNHHFIRIKCLI